MGVDIETAYAYCDLCRDIVIQSSIVDKWKHHNGVYHCEKGHRNRIKSNTRGGLR